MSGTPVIACPAGIWTRIYQFSATFGVVYISVKGPPSPDMSCREYSAALPFYMEGTFTFGSSSTPLVVGPSPYVELWVNPRVSTSIHVLGT